MYVTINIEIFRGHFSKVNTLLIELSNDQKPCIENIFTMCARFHVIISTQMTPKPYIKALILKIFKR